MKNYDSTTETKEHINKVRYNIGLFIDALHRRAEDHDLSKLQEPEKGFFDMYVPLLKQHPYGTPEYEQARKDLSEGLALHYANNTHHPEHFSNGIAGMSWADVAEMLTDWKAAGERNGGTGDILKSIEIGIKRFGIEPQLASILLNTAREMWL